MVIIISTVFKPLFSRLEAMLAPSSLTVAPAYGPGSDSP